MTYPEHLLSDDEAIVRQFRQHWRILVFPVLWVVVGIVAIVLVYQVFPPEDGLIDLITSLAIVALLIPLAVVPFVRWWFTGYVLTTERLITRSGIIAREGIEIPLENINNVLFSQNILERLLKSGDLLIESAGQSGQSRFANIPDPEAFQSLLYRTREQRARDFAREESTMMAEAVGTDPTEQLERLAQLHRDGVITEEEFAAKRQALLDEI